MLEADDPQFLRALSTAASIAVAEFARPPRSLHLHQAHSIAGEAVLRASRTYDPTRGLFAPYAASFVRKALFGLASQLSRRPIPHSLDRTIRQAAEESDTHEDEVSLEISVYASEPIIETLPPESIASLTPNQQAVVRGKYELRQSFAEIGATLRVTRQAAQRTHKRAIRRLRSKATGVPT